MPDWIFKNKPTAYATLATASGTSGATLTLTTGHGTRLPAPGAGQISAVRIENELITYTGNSGDVLTGVTRGAGATNHVAGTEVKNVLVEEWANAVTALSTDTKAALAGTSGTPQAANPYVTDADARNSDARPPTSHGHVESETTGLVADLAARVLTTDGRLSDARTPTAHAISHKATGGDVLASIVGGYAPLDSGLLVPVANLGTGTPTGLKFLRDDRVWAVPAGGGGGAPTTVPYITTASDGTLSAEVVIPGFAGSADVAGNGGAGTSEEYDTGTTGLSWAPSTPETVDSNTTVKSHLYVNQTSTTERFGTKSWSPVGAFDLRVKMWGNGLGLLVADAGNTSRLLLAMGQSIAQPIQAYTYFSGSYTQSGGDSGDRSTQYLRSTRDGSNNISFYWSPNGLIWVLISTASFTLTVAKVGIRTAAVASAGVLDFLRTDV